MAYLDDIEQTAQIGIRTNGSANSTLFPEVTWNDLRERLNEENIAFAESRITMTMTVITVKHSDFNNTINQINHIGFEILN